MDMTIRPRRLRGSEVLRKMVRETRMDKSSLIYPLFFAIDRAFSSEVLDSYVFFIFFSKLVLTFHLQFDLI